MTKKHFIRLADHIRMVNKWDPPAEHFTPKHLDVLATFCKEQNPQFNRTRWLDYIAGTCGPNGGRK